MIKIINKAKEKILVNNLNHLLTIFFAKKKNLIHVVEYPKCGATWVSRLIATYLNVDRKYGRSHLIKYNSIIQKHKLYNPFYHKVIIVVRDPRDVLVSFYFHELYHNKHHKKTRKRIGFDNDLDDNANFSKYVKHKLLNPSKSSPGFSYNRFIESWFKKKMQKPFHLVYYEDLQKDTNKELEKIINFLGFEVVPDKIKEAVIEQSFANISGRKKGQEDKYSHKRKGIVGDWKNYFSPELLEFSMKHQGDIFNKLGYKIDSEI